MNHETAMLAYARLARISHDRQQQQGCDRFLVLTGTAACHAGWPDVAQVCRDRIVAHNPRHFLAKSATFPDALREPANRGFFDHAAKVCTFEQAEYLLGELGGVPQVPADKSAGEIALRELDWDAD